MKKEPYKRIKYKDGVESIDPKKLLAIDVRRLPSIMQEFPSEKFRIDYRWALVFFVCRILLTYFLDV